MHCQRFVTNDFLLEQDSNIAGSRVSFEDPNILENQALLDIVVRPGRSITTHVVRLSNDDILSQLERSVVYTELEERLSSNTDAGLFF